MRIRRFLLLFVSLLMLPSLLQAAEYKKATEGKEVVLSKLYPKNERFELSLPEVGVILNQSYVNTMLIGASATYFWNENLGISLNGSVGQNSDKAERKCIENFYYDPTNEVGSACGGPGNLEGADKNNDGFPKYGPAYVPIREIQQILMANLVWSPVYGKQLFMKSATSYFDLFVELGLGIANSKFYPKSETLKNGHVSRGTYIDPDKNDKQVADDNNSKIGASASETDSYGVPGRPAAKNDTNPLLNLGIGQKFHFGKMFFVKAYIRNMTLLGTESGFENLLVLQGAIGIRF